MSSQNPNPQNYPNFTNPNPNLSFSLPPPSSYPPPVYHHHQNPHPHPFHFHPSYASVFTPPPPSPPHLHHHDFTYLNNPQNPNPNPSAHLMELLNPPSEMPHHISLPMQIPPDLSTGPGSINPRQHYQSPVARMPSGKLPKGRYLVGDRVEYDISVRLPGEVQPQLEVIPITKYGSDPGLVVGRQIAVNDTYICYGLKLGPIRVLNISTAVRSLFKGLAKRVTDMAFFADDVHLLASASVDGRVFVWKITEDLDEEDKPQIAGNIVIAIQITGVGEPVNPRVCWHCHKQEVLVVGIGKYVLKIDTTKVGRGQKFSAEEPLKCSIDKLIDGVQLVGSHDGEVTDLSMCQWMTTRLASSSVDGTIKIWEDRKSSPIAVLRPHDGQPVNSVTFLAAPDQPAHIILISAGPLNREVKLWISAGEEGWLRSDAESWHCTQTLELKCSEGGSENAFFNQVIALSTAGLLVLANAKRNAIYAVHLEYGPNPAATRMDYISEFTVTMPILSFTGKSKSLPNGEQAVELYCVQTQAIQKYDLGLSQCLPPPMVSVVYEKSDSSVSKDVSSVEPFGSKQPGIFDSSSAPISSTHESGSAVTARIGHFGSGASADSSIPQERASSSIETKSVPLSEAAAATNISSITSPSIPLSPGLSGTLSSLRSLSSSFEHVPAVNDRDAEPKVVEYAVDRQMDAIRTNFSDVASLDDDDSGKNDNKLGKFKPPTHLVTPSELRLANSPSEVSHTNEPRRVDDNLHIQDVTINNDTRTVEVEVKVVDETRFSQNNDTGPQQKNQILVSGNMEKAFCPQASDLGLGMAREFLSLSPDTYVVVESRQFDGTFDGTSETEVSAQTSTAEEIHDSGEDVSRKVIDSPTPLPAQQQPAPSAKEKTQKGKGGQGCDFNSTDSSNEPGLSSSTTPIGSTSPQIFAMQEVLNQIVTMQKELQKQMTSTIALAVTKEGQRLEAALGRSMEKAAKSNADALWARFHEENSKQEKAARERTQQLPNMISNCLTKDLPAIIEKTVKREMTAVGQSVGRTIAPVIEKTISLSIVESFQKGVGDKAVNQLEKSVNSKLEATVARQIQAQFQTSGKQALQETLKSNLETSVIPAFERSCRAMFEQVDATFQKGMIEHKTAAQQQFEASHSPLALALREAINSASSVTQTLSSEIVDGQRKLLALAAAGANSNAANPLVSQLSNGPLGTLQEKLEVPLDPTKELSRLVAERKYEEAFTAALQRSDVTIVSWLCSQVDLPGILLRNPLPLSQGVLLSLLQQLACDISNETSRKLGWMREVISAINPSDPMIVVHVRPIFEQVYQILNHHLNLPTTYGPELSNIRLIMHVINSMLMTPK